MVIAEMAVVVPVVMAFISVRKAVKQVNLEQQQQQQTGFT